VTIRWNGGDFEDALNKAAFTQVRDNVTKRLRAARCPEHGTNPTSVTVSGRDLKTLKWEVKGCCDKLTEAAARALK
jgi:hypothetical protein